MPGVRALQVSDRQPLLLRRVHQGVQSAPTAANPWVGSFSCVSIFLSLPPEGQSYDDQWKESSLYFAKGNGILRRDVYGGLGTLS